MRLTTEEARSVWVLRAQNLTLAAGERILCRELSLAVAPGERLAIAGLNGCGSGLLDGAALLLWDEPLNYIDLLTREQIEQAVLEWRPIR